MNKFVNITVSTSISTDFYLEVPENSSEEKIKELAQKEVILPHNYPNYINNFLLKNFGIKVNGIDSMLKSWNIDELTYIVDGGFDINKQLDNENKES